MDPISITALVCAIVSAFTGAASLVKRRKKRKEAAALENSLAIAAPQVRREYTDLARFGAAFAKGDDIGRDQLTSVLLNLQLSMIGTLQAMLNGGRGSYSSLLGISEKARLASIAALGNQYQRLAQAAPIRLQPSWPLPVYVSGRCVLWDNTDQAKFNKVWIITALRGPMPLTVPQGTLCTVGNAFDASYVWVRFIYFNLPTGSYPVPKDCLSRVYTGPYKARVARNCIGTRVTGYPVSLPAGMICDVYWDVSDTFVLVRFRPGTPGSIDMEDYQIERANVVKA